MFFCSLNKDTYQFIIFSIWSDIKKDVDNRYFASFPGTVVSVWQNEWCIAAAIYHRWPVYPVFHCAALEVCKTAVVYIFMRLFQLVIYKWLYILLMLPSINNWFETFIYVHIYIRRNKWVLLKYVYMVKANANF